MPMNILEQLVAIAGEDKRAEIEDVVKGIGCRVILYPGCVVERVVTADMFEGASFDVPTDAQLLEIVECLEPGDDAELMDCGRMIVLGE
jgi:hypothetical protein